MSGPYGAVERGKEVGKRTSDVSMAEVACDPCMAVSRGKEADVITPALRDQVSATSVSRGIRPMEIDSPSAAQSRGRSESSPGQMLVDQVLLAEEQPKPICLGRSMGHSLGHSKSLYSIETQNAEFFKSQPLGQNVGQNSGPPAKETPLLFQKDVILNNSEVGRQVPGNIPKPALVLSPLDRGMDLDRVSVSTIPPAVL